MLSIIITHYQTPVLLKLCLDSIKENIEDLEYEMIVIDSQSEPVHQDIVEERFPQAQFIPFLKNVGCAKVVNTGIKTAKGDYVLILNYDIIISKDSIQQMLEFIKSDLEIGIVGPQLLGFDNSIQNSSFRFPTIKAILARRTFLKKFNWAKKEMDSFLMKGEDLSLSKEIDWVQGSAMLVNRKAINKVGLWDERFFMYLEDTDWCRRFWQNGYKVMYFPKAQMFHYYGRASKKWSGFSDIFFNKYTRIHLLSAFKYFWKWRATPVARKI